MRTGQSLAVQIHVAVQRPVAARGLTAPLGSPGRPSALEITAGNQGHGASAHAGQHGQCVPCVQVCTTARACHSTRLTMRRQHTPGETDRSQLDFAPRSICCIRPASEEKRRPATGLIQIICLADTGGHVSPHAVQSSSGPPRCSRTCDESKIAQWGPNFMNPWRKKPRHFARA